MSEAVFGCILFTTSGFIVGALFGLMVAFALIEKYEKKARIHHE